MAHGCATRKKAVKQFYNLFMANLTKCQLAITIVMYLQLLEYLQLWPLHTDTNRSKLS